jgi:TonB family protein
MAIHQQHRFQKTPNHRTALPSKKKLMRFSALVVPFFLFGWMTPLSAQINVQLHRDSAAIAAQFPGAQIQSTGDYRSKERILLVNTEDFTLRFYLATNGLAYECYLEPKTADVALRQAHLIKETMPHDVANVYIATRFEAGTDRVLIINEPKTNNQGYPHFLYRFFETVTLSEELILSDDLISIESTDHVIAVEEPDVDPNEPLPIAVVSSPPLYGKCTANDPNPMQCSYDAVQQHVAKKLRLPKSATEQGIKGRVFVKLIIGQNGTVETCEILRGLSPEIDQAVLNAFQSLGSFSPPSNRNEPCRVQTVIPITIEP